MGITPKGLSIQSLYRDYRDNKLIVNRKYQRKLVWTLSEKQRLIDTILRDYPLPLFLLAEKKRDDGSIFYEIIDGLQRLNAIFNFIDNEFTNDSKFFDVRQLARANQLAEEGKIKANEDINLILDKKLCANFLDYQLAVTIFPVIQDKDVMDVFNRINSGGRQLSDQERRQAGIITVFGDFVRTLSAEIRGDVSKEKIDLVDMPEISIGTLNSQLKYGLNANETFWCKQGILWHKGLRDSEDEEFIVDIVASILLDKPLDRSKEMLDEIYLENSKIGIEIEDKLLLYGKDKLFNEIIDVVSIFKTLLETSSKENYYFRNLVMGKNRNPAKTAFFSVFLALFALIVKEGKSPDNSAEILNNLKGLHKKLNKSSHYAKSDDRIQNIKITKGLIDDYFVKKEPSALGHGPSLAIDIENSLRRSNVETTRYEFKQGILNLDDKREINDAIYEKIINTICGMANLGKSSEGYIYIGVADKEDDRKKIVEIDKNVPFEIGKKYIVGIERECKLLNWNSDRYVQNLIEKIRSSSLTEPLKTQILTQIDIVEYNKLLIIRIKVPSQHAPSYVGGKIFIRENSNTIQLYSPEKIIAVGELFR